MIPDFGAFCGLYSNSLILNIPSGLFTTGSNITSFADEGQPDHFHSPRPHLLNLTEEEKKMLQVSFLNCSQSAHWPFD